LPNDDSKKRKETKPPRGAQTRKQKKKKISFLLRAFWGFVSLNENRRLMPLIYHSRNSLPGSQKEEEEEGGNLFFLHWSAFFLPKEISHQSIRKLERGLHSPSFMSFPSSNPNKPEQSKNKNTFLFFFFFFSNPVVFFFILGFLFFFFYAFFVGFSCSGNLL
jgi:hypothetical protein